MPQLDASAYWPQVFWLLVLFYIIYFFFFKEFFFLITGSLYSREYIISFFFSKKATQAYVKNSIFTNIFDIILPLISIYFYFEEQKFFNNFNTLYTFYLYNLYTNFFYLLLETFSLILNEVTLLLEEEINFMFINEFFSILQEMIDEI
jgi:hypothetical protein